MRTLLCLLLLAGCTSDIQQTSFGSISVAPTARFSRAEHGTGNYGGTGVHKWIIAFATADGCGKDTVAAIEVNTLLTGAATFPMGAIPFRVNEIPDTYPSALVRIEGATTTSGSISIDMTGTQIQGSAAGSLSTGELTASFMAYNCTQ